MHVNHYYHSDIITGNAIFIKTGLFLALNQIHKNAWQHNKGVLKEDNKSFFSYQRRWFPKHGSIYIFKMTPKSSFVPPISTFRLFLNFGNNHRWLSLGNKVNCPFLTMDFIAKNSQTPTVNSGTALSWSRIYHVRIRVFPVTLSDWQFSLIDIVKMIPYKQKIHKHSQELRATCALFVSTEKTSLFSTANVLFSGSYWKHRLSAPGNEPAKITAIFERSNE